MIDDDLKLPDWCPLEECKTPNNNEENSNSVALDALESWILEWCEDIPHQEVELLRQLFTSALPSGEHNTPKNKIKPCNNKECEQYLVGEKEGFNCKGHIRGAVIYCPVYRA